MKTKVEYLYTAKHYLLLERLFYISVLGIWTYKMLHGMWINEFAEAVLPYEGRDPFYWLLVGLKIPQFFIQKAWILWIIDIVIPLTALGNLLFPKKLLFNWLFTGFYVVYFLLFNTFSGHHYHSIGIIFVSSLFLFQPADFKSELLFRFSRYYFFFMLVSAFTWKLIRGNLVDIDHFSEILLDQNIYFLQAESNTWRAEILYHLIEHPTQAHFFWIGLMILQASFVLGFFTKRLDSWLILNYLIFLAGSWFLMNIVNLDNYCWIFVLLPYGLLQKSKLLKS